jgi:hypothetical protein
MATIQLIKGEFIKKLSVPNTKWVLKADNDAVFQFAVPDWKSQNINKKVVWKWWDKEKKILIEPESNLKTTDVFDLKMIKRRAGVYHYILEAILMENDKVLETTQIFIQGFCDPEIVSEEVLWSKQKISFNKDNKPTFLDQSEIHYGHELYFSILAYGLNGVTVELDIFNIKNSKYISKKTTKPLECSGGYIETDIMTLPFFNGLVADIEPYVVQFKTTDNKVYYNDKKESEIIKFNIKNKFVLPTVKAPQNLTPCKVGETRTCKSEIGIISLDRIKVLSEYDVCHDDVKHYYDYENFWVLQDKDVAGNPTNFHWMKNRNEKITYEDYDYILEKEKIVRTKGYKKEVNDNNKPSNIPITISSEEYFEFKAIFKTIISGKKIKIRVTHKTNSGEATYSFNDTPLINTTKKGKEFEVIFKSTNQPFKNTARHIENFELLFEYSFSGKNWLPLGNAQFCLYLTWKKPIYKAITNKDVTLIEYGSGGIYNYLIKKDKLIYESVLCLGCKKGTDNKNISETSEDKIMENIFKQFKDLNLKRARETKPRPDGKSYYFKNSKLVEGHGLGYWRNTSGLGKLENVDDKLLKDYFNEVRGLRIFLRTGEARCGEFNSLLQAIFGMQGIKGLNDYAISTDTYSFKENIKLYSLITIEGNNKKKYYFERKIKDLLPLEKNDRYQTEDFPIENNDGKAPIAYFIKVETIVGKDKKTGAPIKEKFDKGMYVQKGNSTIIDIKYDTFYNSIFLVKGVLGWETYPKNSLQAPTQKVNKFHKKLAQGNSNPMHFFWDHIFMVHKRVSKNLYEFKFYDPSYGVVDEAYRLNSEDVLKQYVPNALEAVIDAAIPENGQGEPFYDKNHSDEYQDLFIKDSTTKKSSAKVYNYRYEMGVGMANKLIKPSDEDLKKA